MSHGKAQPNVRVQPQRARRENFPKTTDLAREAVGWNDMFGGMPISS
jgi:hypothetical protein